MKLQKAYGIDSGASWHTMYTWFANDVSFYLVPVWLFVIMFYFGYAWKDFVINRNPIAFLILMLFVLMIMFISANNQVFSQYDSLFAFFMYMIIWIHSREKYNWKELLYEKNKN